MADIMRPVPFQELLERIAGEYRNHGSVFGIDNSLFYDDAGKKRIGILSSSCTMPLGPAAGPHTQLAQNIIASYLVGARFIELKTVQINDRLEIAKPCIDARDEVYNAEWSTEFTLEKAYDEYLKPWIILHILEACMHGRFPDEPSFLFNMSVGYDLKGIKEERMQIFIDNMIECRKDAFADYIAQAAAALEDNIFEGTGWEGAALKAASELDRISRKIASSATISTMHGCPPDEIEAICSYMIETKHIDIFVKLNPTLLGYDRVRSILDRHGYSNVGLRRESFEHDLQKEDAFPMLERLEKKASSCGVGFGVKLTNTLASISDGRVLPGNEKYMSGKALFPVSLEVARKIAEHFDGRLPISFSGGVSVLNAAALFDAGIHPITLASDMLRPGGYPRMLQIARSLISADGWSRKLVDPSALVLLGKESEESEAFSRAKKRGESVKIGTPLPLVDCFVAPCVEACPIHQDIPDYIALAGEGRWAEALGLIYLKNALPNITGWICDHQCQNHCTRMDYEGPVAIREVKRLAAEKGRAEFLSEIWEKPEEPADVKAAVIGAGPAGLAAAYFLARAGFDTSLYEKEATAGGVVRSTIPEFRIPEKAIDDDVEFIRECGVGFHFSESVTVGDLRKAGFEYIFIAIGAEKEKSMDLPGNGPSEGAVAFLRRCKSGESINIGEHVVVVGGGNTAMDASRMAKRIPGVKDVTVVYRRSEEEMPADEEEYTEALDEGIAFQFLHNPVSFQDGEVELAVMELGEEDASGRRRPVDTGKRESIRADYLIYAIGESVDKSVLEALGADSASEEDGVFIIGDAVTGPSTVVRCISSARAAVDKAIDAVYDALSAEDDDEDECTCGHDHEHGEECTCGHHHHDEDEEEELSEKEEAELREAEDNFFLNIISKKSHLVPPGQKGDEFFALSEASRCVECSYLCLKCVEVCPNRANVAIDMRETGLFEDPFQVVHLDAYCNECGNCATFCPHSGRPYRDKLTIFSLREDFEESDASGFYAEGDAVLIRLDGRVQEGRIGRDGNLEADVPEEIAAIIEKIYLSYSYLLGPVEE